MLIAKLEAPAGIISDRKKIREQIASMSEAGFVFADLPPNVNLPQDAKLVIVQNTLGANRAIDHEKLEILGLYIDETIGTDKAAKKIEALTSSLIKDQDVRSRVRQALYDLAAKAEDGSTVHGLGGLGVSREWSQEHPQEAELLFGILQKINNKLADAGGLSAEDASANRQNLANLIRSGAIRPENLYGYFAGEPFALVEKGDDSAGVEAFYSPYEIVPITKEGMEGRFVFNKPTLNPGDTFEHEGVIYQIKRVLKAGGQGVVYEAQYIGSYGQPYQVAIKEMIFETGEALLFFPQEFIFALERQGLSFQDIYKRIAEYAGQAGLGMAFGNYIKKESALRLRRGDG
mgnify:CR=1 FL=1